METEWCMSVVQHMSTPQGTWTGPVNVMEHGVGKLQSVKDLVCQCKVWIRWFHKARGWGRLAISQCNESWVWIHCIYIQLMLNVFNNKEAHLYSQSIIIWLLFSPRDKLVTIIFFWNKHLGCHNIKSIFSEIHCVIQQQALISVWVCVCSFSGYFERTFAKS